jgi:dTDP-4-amino-4,6-dideoxygalactose transaminase
MHRSIPPTAAPVDFSILMNGLAGLISDHGHMKRLEAEIREYFNINHVFLVSSGKAALAIALRALKRLSPDKNEVIIPAYTCYSVPSAILKAGLKITLCDVDPSTFDFNYDQLEKTINKNTLCIVPTHLFGIPADMGRINRLREDRDLFILEDAAQAMGGIYDNRKLGTIGDIGIFSFDRGKNITCGSGGIIITNSDKIAHAINNEYLTLKKPHTKDCILEYVKLIVLALFIHPSLYWLPSGLAFLKLGETTFHKDFPVTKLSGMHAALLRGWRKRLEQSNRSRKQNADYLCEMLGLKSWQGLSVNFLRLPFVAENKQTRDDIYFLSNKEGVGISRMYPSPINEIQEIKSSFNGQSFPSAKWLSERLLTIPTHHLLTGRDKEKIISKLSTIGCRKPDHLRITGANS